MTEEQKNESPENELETLVVDELAKSFKVDGREIIVRMEEEKVLTCIDGECHDTGEGRGVFDALMGLLEALAGTGGDTGEEIEEDAD